MKKIITIAIIIFLLFAITTSVKAAGTVSLSNSNSNINVGDEFSISVNLSGASVATLTVRVSVDTSKVDYVSGPANSSFSNGRAIYTWTDATGGNTPITGGTIVTFRFRAKEAGVANFSVSGDLYTPEEDSVNPSFSGTSVTINSAPAPNEETQTSPPPSGNTPPPVTPAPTETQAGGTSNNNGNALSSNNNLRSLSLDKEGLSPSFNKNTTLYTIIIGSEVENIDVLATPEDAKSSLTITGNNNLQIGVNKIEITVTAQNGNKKIYTINATKTENPELANANLENLAIENVLLTPEFSQDVTEYIAEVGNDVENLNVLAIPQREAAIVTIEGHENLQFGENFVTITVQAEDGITTKIYTVNVHKKTQLEEEQVIGEVRTEISKDYKNKIKAASIWMAIFLISIITAVGLTIGWLIAQYTISQKKEKIDKKEE